MLVGDLDSLTFAGSISFQELAKPANGTFHFVEYNVVMLR